MANGGGRGSGGGGGGGGKDDLVFVISGLFPIPLRRRSTEENKRWDQISLGGWSS